MLTSIRSIVCLFVVVLPFRVYMEVYMRESGTQGISKLPAIHLHHCINYDQTWCKCESAFALREIAFEEWEGLSASRRLDLLCFLSAIFIFFLFVAFLGGKSHTEATSDNARDHHTHSFCEFSVRVFCSSSNGEVNENMCLCSIDVFVFVLVKFSTSILYILKMF